VSMRPELRVGDPCTPPSTVLNWERDGRLGEVMTSLRDLLRPRTSSGVIRVFAKENARFPCRNPIAVSYGATDG
jgi:hypothetical protein